MDAKKRNAPPQGASSGSESRSFRDASHELGRLLQSRAPVDWQRSRRWCSEILTPVIEASPTSRRLTEVLEGHPYIVGGDEHHVINVESDPERIYKITHNDNFGCISYFSPHDPDLTGKHFHGTGNADPFLYLKRWRILNLLSGYKTRFEGFLLPERPHWVPRVCISQPKLGGDNPNVEDIRSAMKKYGFDEISENAFLHFETRVLLTDMAPRNVRIVDGVPVPFDAIATFATPEVLEWARRER